MRQPALILPRVLYGISLRLLVLNLLVVFLPVAAVLTLGTYERQLLGALEHALVQQARLMASALSGDADLNLEEARDILTQLAGRHEARLRVVDMTGRPVADSSRLDQPEPDLVPDSSLKRAVEPDAQANPLYRLASGPVRFYRRYLSAPTPPLQGSEFYSGVSQLDGAEVRAALQGRYGAATRISSGGQVSVTLYSAIPIWSSDREVVGAVVASQSTYRILTDLYTLRLDVFRIFLFSMMAAVALTLFLSATITRPIHRLRDEAARIVDARGRLVAPFHPSGRRDEIGDLSRSLQVLTQRLDEYLRFMESFAADVSHELKNPLAAVRSAADVAAELTDPNDQRRFLDAIQVNVRRMERLLTDLREITRLDADTDQGSREPVDLAALAEGVAGAWDRRRRSVRVICERSKGPIVIPGHPERLVRAVENLLDNAVSFSPDGERVDLLVRREDSLCVIEVADRGPGIAAEGRDRIFDRFYSDRPDGDNEGSPHTGLGLAIVKSIIETHGGVIGVGEREGGGATFRVMLPIAP